MNQEDRVEMREGQAMVDDDCSELAFNTRSKLT